MLKRTLHYLGYLIILLLVIAVGGFFYLKTPDSNPEAVLKKYTNQHSKFAENGKGLKVHYRDQGNPDGPPLMLIHGSSASLHTFEPMIPHLKDKYRIISLTLPGHGLTGPHPKDDYSSAGYHEAIDLVAKQLNLANFAITGNSLGGWLSWRYTLKNPDKINALILLNAAGMPLRKGETRPPANLAFKLARYSTGRFLLQNITPRSLVKKSLLQTVTVKESVTEEVIERYYNLVRLPGNRRAASLRRQADREPGFAANFSTIKKPTLIIWGKDDRLIYASAAQSFKDRKPDAKIIIYNNVGHIPMEEVPERTAKDIDAFLSEVLKTDEKPAEEKTEQQ